MSNEQVALEAAAMTYATMIGKIANADDAAYRAVISYAAIAGIEAEEARERVVREYQERRDFYAGALLESFAQTLTASVIQASVDSQAVEWGLDRVPADIMMAIGYYANAYALVAKIPASEAIVLLRGKIHELYIKRHDR